VKRAKPGHPQHSNKVNRRNKAIKLRALLLSACKRLDEYGIELPDRVHEWWKAQKNLALIRRMQSSEFGVLQQALAAEEERERKLNEVE